VPEGLGLVSRIPISPTVASALRFVALSAAVTTALGYKSRASAGVLTVSAGLLFSLSQRSGAVVHDMHLFWMTALLAASPCGDTWSLDAWGKERAAPSMRYGVPLAFARALLGVVYFFPGLHKLRVSGLAWMTSDNVIGHMQAKWLEHGEVPIFRLDHAPLLCTIGAFSVVLFELSFVVLSAVPRTRLVALAGGFVFHLTTQIFFFITFTSLWACYVVLLPIDRVPPDRDARPLRATIAVGSILLLLAIVQGARGVTHAWPFACYPTFSHLQQHEIPDIVVEADSVRLTGRERRARTQAEWGRVFRISGAYGDPIDEAQLRAHAREVLAGRKIEGPIRLYRVMVSTEPERWNEAPEGGVLLTELAPLLDPAR
jgi:hypothetical protein